MQFEKRGVIFPMSASALGVESLRAACDGVGRPDLANLLRRIATAVADSDAALEDRRAAHRVAQTAAWRASLIVDAVASSSHADVAMRALHDEYVGDSDPGAPIHSASAAADARRYFSVIIESIRASLGASEMDDADGGVASLQSDITSIRNELIDQRASVRARLASLDELLRTAIDLSLDLVKSHKLGRQRSLDETTVDVLMQRTVAFQLKLQSMNAILLRDTYSSAACKALDCIRRVNTVMATLLIYV